MADKIVNPVNDAGLKDGILDDKVDQLVTPQAEVIPEVVPEVVPPVVNPVVETETYVEGDVVEIESTEGTLSVTIDKDGNALNDKGETVYTKQQLIDLAKTAPDETILTTLSLEQLSGVSLTNDKGEPIEYDLSTIDGIAQREADVYQKGVLDASNDAVDRFFNENPDLYDAFIYKQTYGSFEGYDNRVDFKTIDLSNKDKGFLESIIRQAKRQQGLDDEEINDFITYANANDTLSKNADKAKSFLAGKQEADIQLAKQKRDAELDEASEAMYQVIGAEWDNNGRIVEGEVDGSIYDMVVKKGQVGGLVIPKNGVSLKIQGKDTVVSRTDLFNYLIAPTVEVNGNYFSPAQVALNKIFDDPQLFTIYALRQLLGEDYKQLVDATIQDNNVKRIKLAASKQGINPTVKRANASGGKIILPVK